MSRYSVSIIIPVYNGEKTIVKCVNSVLGQTLQDIQVIVINDGSKDNTQALLDKFTERNVRIISKENTGVSDTRNIGVKLAEGEYVFFLDSDDWIDSNLLEKMHSVAINNHLDMVSCGVVEHNSTRVNSRLTTPFCFVATKSKAIGRHLLDTFPQSACAKLFRTDLIKDNNIIFPPQMSHGEDMYFTYSFLFFSNRIGSISDSFYHVQNVNPISLSKKYVPDLGNDLIEQYLLYCKVFEKYPDAVDVFNKKKMYLPVLLFSAYADNQFKPGNDVSFINKTQRIRLFIKNNKIWYDNERLISKSLFPNGVYKKIVYLLIRLNVAPLIAVFFMIKECVKEHKYKKMV